MIMIIIVIVICHFVFVNISCIKESSFSKSNPFNHVLYLGNESTTRIPATEAIETTAVPNNYTPTVQSTRPTQHVTSGTIR